MTDQKHIPIRLITDPPIDPIIVKIFAIKLSPIVPWNAICFLEIESVLERYSGVAVETSKEQETQTTFKQ
jgi:hypothetical protein